jgi:hypothetical protein
MVCLPISFAADLSLPPIETSGEVVFLEVDGRSEN